MDAYMPAAQPLERDLLATRGWGVFTVFRARQNVLFHQEDHMQRLIESCKGARIDLALLPSHDVLLKRIWSHLEMYGYRESVVRVSITAGDSANHKDRNPESAPKILILVDEYKEPDVIVPISLLVRRGGRLRPDIKMIGAYADSMIDLAEAHDAGLDDVLYVSDTGDFKETTCANIFIVTKSNELWTPKENVLKGVTRSIILKLAEESKLFTSIDEVPRITENHIPAFEEVFRTASISGIVPVQGINGSKFFVGEETKTAQLATLYQKYVEAYFADRRVPS